MKNFIWTKEAKPHPLTFNYVSVHNRVLPLRNCTYYTKYSAYIMSTDPKYQLGVNGQRLKTEQHQHNIISRGIYCNIYGWCVNTMDQHNELLRPRNSEQYHLRCYRLFPLFCIVMVCVWCRSKSPISYDALIMLALAGFSSIWPWKRFFLAYFPLFLYFFAVKSTLKFLLYKSR